MDACILARLQFAFTASFHFIFVPLSIGLSFLLAIMETLYVTTKNDAWKQATQFWGTLFGINFALGVSTGIPLEFQFGTNWGRYSYYVGNIFGPLLAMEGLMAFFLEATFVGMFFFGWKRLSARQHLFCTWMVTLGTTFSAFWILIANAWMQHPVGARFCLKTQRMELESLTQVILNPVAQCKFAHTMAACYTVAATFVLGICAFYLKRGRHKDLAQRSARLACLVGLTASIMVAVMGDKSGYVANHHQQMKIAAIEGIWETETPPAGFTLVGWPDQNAQCTHFAIRIPWVLGLLVTHSWTQPVWGIKDLVAVAEQRIRLGVKACGALDTLRQNPHDPLAQKVFEKHQNNLGYGLLVRRYCHDVTMANDDQIAKAAKDTIPNVVCLFWAFRVMVGIGFYLIAFFGVAFWALHRHQSWVGPWLWRMALWTIPLPWIAAQLGWLVAEYGRQPWVVEGVLPSFLGIGSVGSPHILFTLIGFIIFYVGLFSVGMWTLVRCIRAGPIAILEKGYNDA